MDLSSLSFPDITKWFTDGKNLQGLGSVLSAGGSIYSGIQQGQYAKDLINLQKQNYARQVNREDQQDANLANGFNNSSYGLVKLS